MMSNTDSDSDTAQQISFNYWRLYSQFYFNAANLFDCTISFKPENHNEFTKRTSNY
jgi:hypothetical protein